MKTTCQQYREREEEEEKKGLQSKGEGKLPSCNDVTVQSNSRIK